MPRGKSDEEQAQKQTDKEAKRHARSPVGRAEAAFERGNRFFEVELVVSEEPDTLIETVGSLLTSVVKRRRSEDAEAPTGGDDVLGSIEEVGWDLEHVGYMYVPKSTTSSGGNSSTTHYGKTVGVYLFRRVEGVAPSNSQGPVSPPHIAPNG